MKRLTWFSAVLAAFLASSLGFAQVGAPVAGASGPPAGTYTQAQQITAAQALSVPYVLSKSSITFVVPATGTMGNNGALTVGTALPSAYAHAFFFMPAGSVAAGVPAAATWLYTECTTTTACINYNNAYTSGTPSIPSKVAFSTTGPGAYTGDTTDRVGPLITVPAGAMTANAVLRMSTGWSATNNADLKTATIKVGATAIIPGMTLASTLAVEAQHTLRNQGVVNSQVGVPNAATFFGITSATSARIFTSIDFSSSQNLSVVIGHGTATDNAILEGYMFEILSDGT